MVWLDMDLVIMKNIDELFDIPYPSFVMQQIKDHEENIKAINSGLFIIIPNNDTVSKVYYFSLITLNQIGISQRVSVQAGVKILIFILHH